MNFTVIPVTAYQQNCSLIWCPQTNKAALIDPGGEVDKLLSAVEERGLELEKILVTHAHIDHVGAVGEVASRCNLPIEGPHQEDKFWIDMLPQQSMMMNFPSVQGFIPSRWLQDQDQVTVGDQCLRVLHCPGHTPGHVVFYHADSKLAFVGDVLFKGGIGRTDFPRGDYGTLINSIRQKLLTLGDDVQFVPGHGPLSTIGNERQSNPFVGNQMYG